MALAGLGGLAAISLGLSALPAAEALPLAALSFAQGLWLARREWRRTPCTLELGHGGAMLMRAGGRATPVESPRLALRGVLASLSFRVAGGGRESLLWCADTLPASARRQLRLHLGPGSEEAAP